MDSMVLDINVISATGLNEAGLASKMKIYAVVSVTGEVQSDQTALTNVDGEGGGNPTWNFTVTFVVDGLQTCILFALRCEDPTGDRDVGEVRVPVAELLQSAGDGNSMRCVSYPVKKPSGQTEGTLNFEYKFSGSPTTDKPAAACTTRGVGYYPPPLAAGYGSYPPSAQPYGPHSPPPPSHYMPSPPSPYGYAYPSYNVGPPSAPPYIVHPPHPSNWHAHPSPAVYGARSLTTSHQGKKPKWGAAGAKMLGGMFSTLALGVGSLPVPDASIFASQLLSTSGLEYLPQDLLSYTSSFPDISNFLV